MIVEGSGRAVAAATPPLQRCWRGDPCGRPALLRAVRLFGLHSVILPAVWDTKCARGGLPT
jgi:hypothetical protein